MTSARIIAIFLVLVTGIGLSYWILNDTLALFNASPKTNLAVKTPEATPLTGEPLDFSNNSQGGFPYKENEEGINSDNLSESLSNRLVKELQAEKNRSDSFLPSAGSVDRVSEKVIGDFVKRAKSEMDFTVKDSDILISRDNSNESKASYLRAVSAVAQNYRKDFSKNYKEILADVVQKGDLNSAQTLSSVYGNMARDYYNIKVPSDWLYLHKRMILQFKQGQFVFGSVATYQEDPIKANFGMGMFNELVLNAKVNQEMVNSKVKEIKFTQ